MEDTQIYDHSRCDNNVEEDYIELEVIGSSNSTISLFHFKNPSPPPQQEEARSSEFEFQMLPNFIDRNITSSTADELFHNGKLLPLDHISLHHNNPITNKFLHVGKNIVESCNVSHQDYFFDYSRSSKYHDVSKSFDDFDQSLSTWKQPLAEIQGTTTYNSSMWSGPSSNRPHSGSFSAPDCPFCQSCHASRKLNQEEYYYSTNDESTSKTSKNLLVSESFGDFDQSLDTPFCQSCHVSRELINQEEHYYNSTHDKKSTSKILHVSKSFDDLKLSFDTPFFQSCHVSGELSNQEDYYYSFGYSTDGESSRKSKWPKGSLTRKLRLIKQLSFDHSKLKCLINTSVNKLVAKKEYIGKNIHHKKSSFAGAIKRLLATKSCSSKSTSNVNIQEMHLIVRRDHVYGEVDPIQAAIAYCKNSRKSNVSDNTIELGRSLSPSKIMFEEQERKGLCRG
ncbi:hypothetical protein FXO38_02642 [Capsicum annuum]|nr:hypothetical protein FXO38_02642 [Capsicum annuum]KAF3685817.1 hypothetical protein FXO37_00208 [Capsicum annuum]